MIETLAVTVITCNEESNIRGALESVAWADEIIIVDSGSKDGTLRVCREFTEKIYHRDWTGFVDQKNFAVDQASHDWIFSLDADERASVKLQEQIRHLRQSGFLAEGYRMPRVAQFMGRWIRHGDWYPDYQLRLFDRRKGRWQGGRVHESIRIKGTPDYLDGEILHFTYPDLSAYLRRLDLYSSLAAADYQSKGRRATPLALLANPVAAFVRGYLLKRGFLDGAPGLMVAVMAAVSVYFKYAKLFEIQRRQGRE